MPPENRQYICLNILPEQNPIFIYNCGWEIKRYSTVHGVMLYQPVGWAMIFRNTITGDHHEKYNLFSTFYLLQFCITIHQVGSGWGSAPVYAGYCFPRMSVLFCNTDK